MKILLFTFISALFLQSCDAPQRTRFQDVGSINGTSQSNSGKDSTDKSDTSDNTDKSGSGTTTTPDPNEEGFKNCATDLKYFGGSIGYFGICQSTIMKSKFKFKMAETDTSNGTCFIPVHFLSGGNSFKLGRAECVHNQANKEYFMTLTVDRSETINGVMVIKSNSVTSYMSCMNAKQTYYNAYPGCQNNSNCIAAANNYANTICTNFKNYHSNNYKQIQF